jgi:S-adenosylmethionine synthetase
VKDIVMTTILRPAEWVLPGHPDKLADAIADTLVQAAWERQREALCAIEVAVHRDAVYLTGRMACEGSDQIDIASLVRGVYASAGYGGHWRPAPADLKVGGNLCIDTLTPGEERIRHISDDQSIVTGYAIDLPGIGFIPPEQWLARELARRLFRLVFSPLGLCPDGKVLVVLEEAAENRRLHSVSCSLLAEIGDIELHRAVVEAIGDVVRELAGKLPGFNPKLPEDIVVNGSGTFAIGGPEGDNGLSGKKLLLDHYGPRVAIGGTALSGKDFWKPDRAGTLLARRLALAVVRSGVAAEATVQFATCAGDETPRLVRTTTPAGELPHARRWLDLVSCRFALAADWPLGLDLAESGRWGWFGGSGGWEELALE